MNYYKLGGNYLKTNDTLPDAEVITETQYQAILEIIRARPEIPEGYGARLTEALTWELYPLPPEEPEDPGEQNAPPQHTL